MHRNVNAEYIVGWNYWSIPTLVNHCYDLSMLEFKFIYVDIHGSLIPFEKNQWVYIIGEPILNVTPNSKILYKNLE